MKFDTNPYCSPNECGLKIIKEYDTAGSYEFDKFVVWEDISTKNWYYDRDSGCSCPSPFDNSDHGHELKIINKQSLSTVESDFQAYANSEYGENKLTPVEKLEFIQMIRKKIKEASDDGKL